MFASFCLYLNRNHYLFLSYKLIIPIFLSSIVQFIKLIVKLNPYLVVDPNLWQLLMVIIFGNSLLIFHIIQFLIYMVFLNILLRLLLFSFLLLPFSFFHCSSLLSLSWIFFIHWISLIYSYCSRYLSQASLCVSSRS